MGIMWTFLPIFPPIPKADLRACPKGLFFCFRMLIMPIMIAIGCTAVRTMIIITSTIGGMLIRT